MKKENLSLHSGSPTQTGLLSMTACFLSERTRILLETTKSRRVRANTPPASRKETVGFLSCDKGETDPGKDNKPG